jgi:hypothetical protein
MRETLSPQHATQCHVTGDIWNGKRLWIIPLAEPRYNAEAILKNWEMFIYIDAFYIINSFCKSVEISESLANEVNSTFYNFFCYYH